MVFIIITFAEKRPLLVVSLPQDLPNRPDLCRLYSSRSHDLKQTVAPSTNEHKTHFPTLSSRVGFVYHWLLTQTWTYLIGFYISVRYNCQQLQDSPIVAWSLPFLCLTILRKFGHRRHFRGHRVSTEESRVLFFITAICHIYICQSEREYLPISIKHRLRRISFIASTSAFTISAHAAGAMICFIKWKIHMTLNPSSSQVYNQPYDLA